MPHPTSLSRSHEPFPIFGPKDLKCLPLKNRCLLNIDPISTDLASSRQQLPFARPWRSRSLLSVVFSVTWTLCMRVAFYCAKVDLSQHVTGMATNHYKSMIWLGNHGSEGPEQPTAVYPSTRAKPAWDLPTPQAALYVRSAIDASRSTALISFRSMGNDRSLLLHSFNRFFIRD